MVVEVPSLADGEESERHAECGIGADVDAGWHGALLPGDERHDQGVKGSDESCSCGRHRAGVAVEEQRLRHAFTKVREQQGRHNGLAAVSS